MLSQPLNLCLVFNLFQHSLICYYSTINQLQITNHLFRYSLCTLLWNKLLLLFRQPHFYQRVSIASYMQALV